MEQAMLFVQGEGRQVKGLDKFPSTTHIQIDGNVCGPVCGLNAIAHLRRRANVPDAICRVMLNLGDTAGEQFRLSEQSIQHAVGRTRRE